MSTKIIAINLSRIPKSFEKILFNFPDDVIPKYEQGLRISP